MFHSMRVCDVSSIAMFRFIKGCSAESPHGSRCVFLELSALTTKDDGCHQSMHHYQEFEKKSYPCFVRFVIFRIAVWTEPFDKVI